MSVYVILNVISTAIKALRMGKDWLHRSRLSMVIEEGQTMALPQWPSLLKLPKAKGLKNDTSLRFANAIMVI